jgi:predicted MPP superfamily phosphohydrolase
MSTASLRVLDDEYRARRARHRTSRPRKPPVPLRPLHRIWRRTIDNIEVVPINLPVRQLAPSLTGVVACQISDLHVDRDEDLARLHSAVTAINNQKPDLVFLTGDYFSGGDTMRRYAREFTRTIAELRPSAGIFAILGNHDHWASASFVSEALHRAGGEVLSNENRHVSLRGAQLAIVGIDDLWSRRAEPGRAFQGIDADDSSIVLAHNPDTALYTRHLQPGVMLSGHTHGGVVRIPYYGSPIKSILRIGKKYYSGLNRYNEFYIYTNRGLGTFWLRIRINCRPEVSLFNLVSLADANSADSTMLSAGNRRNRRLRAIA